MSEPTQPTGGETPRPVPALGGLRIPLDRIPLRPALDDEPVIAVPPEVLARYNARVLDPTSVPQVAEQTVRSTIYIGDQLIVGGAATFDARSTLTDVATELHLSIEPPVIRESLRDQRVEVARTVGRADAETMFHSVHELKPLPGFAVVPDAWQVLQQYRARVQADDALRARVGPELIGLDHLLTTCRHVTSTPFDPTGRPAMAASGSYADPGWGGRAPVNWIGPKPARHGDEDLPCGRRPVVAVLDTGVGVHEWWKGDTPETTGIVVRNPEEGGIAIGLTDPLTDPENRGVVEDQLEGVLDSHSGHGTFIAGLIHQLCPDAVILAIRVTPSMGWVPEHVVLDALNALVCRQQRAIDGDPTAAIDVVCLSLGYYDELDSDPANKPFLLEPITQLCEMGVAVVASAGNDATSRPMYPAAFAPNPGGPIKSVAADCLPVTSVGATNPNGTTTLFSNSGRWVSCRRPGAALVSTFPQTFNASAQPAYAVRVGDEWRATLDPDDFSAGFGTWSGTSFAAPILAGEIAQHIIDQASQFPPEKTDKPSAVARGAAALRAAMTKAKVT
jgi:hypothetical protein